MKTQLKLIIAALAAMLCMGSVFAKTLYVDCGSAPGSTGEIVPVNWSGCSEGYMNLTGSRFEGSVMRGTKLDSDKLIDAHVEGSDLTRSQITNSDLSGGHFEDVKLVNATLDSDNLNYAHLERSDLRGVKVSNSELRHTRLDVADMRGAMLDGVDLRYSHLKGTNLRGASLVNADLENANLFGAKLYGANLSGADLSGAFWVDGTRCGSGSIGMCKHV